MNRELKFRVWNGMEMVYDVTVGKFGTFYVNPGDKGNGLDTNDSASLTPFTTKYADETPVMQFTGLKDKDGKDVFEGDILQITDWDLPKEFRTHDDLSHHKIIWDNENCKFSDTRLEDGDSLTEYENTFDWVCESKVIGNIYENPNLIPSGSGV